MAIALSFLSSTLLAPLQAVVLFFAPHAVVAARSPVPGAQIPSTQQLGTLPAQGTQRLAAPSHALRVLRVSESGIPAGSAGRMRMSGRFADVCAELDRMAAQEMRAA